MLNHALCFASHRYENKSDCVEKTTKTYNIGHNQEQILVLVLFSRQRWELFCSVDFVLLHMVHHLLRNGVFKVAQRAIETRHTMRPHVLQEIRISLERLLAVNTNGRFGDSSIVTGAQMLPEADEVFNCNGAV